MENTDGNFFNDAQEQAYLNALAEEESFLEAERNEHMHDYQRYMEALKKGEL